MKERLKKIVDKFNENRTEIALTASALVSVGIWLYYNDKLFEYKHRIPAYMTRDGVVAMEEGRLTTATIDTEFYHVEISKKN